MQFDVTSDDAFRPFLPGQPQEDDKTLIVTFYTDKKLLVAKSQAEGREIYEDREYVKIQIKGQDKQVWVGEATQEYKRKYPIAYAQFIQKRPAVVVGTPIEQMPGIGPSKAHHFRSLNLLTIEDVANVTDENTIAAMGMGARDDVRRAKAWVSQTNTEVVALRERVAALESQKPGAYPELKIAKNRRGVPKKVRVQTEDPAP